VSVVALVVRVTPLPATIVKVSDVESATILDWPDTETVVNACNAPVFVTVNVSVAALVVILMPLPGANVNVSVTESATISDWPDTEIVLNAVPAFAMVKVSVVALVVRVTPLPATIVKVSVVESATISDCPATAIVVKDNDGVPPDADMVRLSVTESVVRVTPLPATIVKVSVVESATIFD